MIIAEAVTLASINIETFKKHPDYLIYFKMSPSAEKLYRVLLNLKERFGEVFMKRAFLATLLGGLAKTTISTAMTELEKLGLAKRSERKKDNLYPFVELCDPKEVLNSKLSSSHLLTTQLANANPHIKIEQNISKQTKQATPRKAPQPKNDANADVCFSDNLNSPDLIEAQKALTAHGVNHKQAQKLTELHGSQAVITQVEHLTYLQDKGQEIKNPAGWLYRAIKNNYVVPKDLKTVAEVKEAQQQKEQIRHAEICLERAEHLEQKQALEAAKEALDESLRVHPLEKAKELMQNILRRINRKKLLEQAKQKITNDQQEQLMAQAKEETQMLFRKLGQCGDDFERKQL